MCAVASRVGGKESLATDDAEQVQLATDSVYTLKAEHEPNVSNLFRVPLEYPTYHTHPLFPSL